jgi:hypothetical protein
VPKKSWSKGANKALSAMQKQYGKAKGERVFFAKANKNAAPKLQGKSQNKRVSSYYKTGGTQKAKKRH